MKIINYEASPALGITFKAKTFIIELENEILIISPCKMSEEEISSLNRNKDIHVISPNNFHTNGLAHLHGYLPHVNYWGPKRSAKVSRLKLKNLSEFKVDGIKTIKIDGHPLLSETCFYIESTKELIITDLAFNMHHKMNLATKLMMKLVGTYHRLDTSKMLLKGVKDKDAFKSSLNELCELDIDNVLLNHGDSISKKELVEHFQSLLNRQT